MRYCNNIILLFICSIAQAQLVPSADSETYGKAYFKTLKQMSIKADNQPLAAKNMMLWLSTLNSEGLKTPFTNAKMPSVEVSKSKEKGYKISITKDRVYVNYFDDAALFYASVSLMQLSKFENGMLSLQECEISDGKEAIGWRGLHLDCSRHFFSVAEVKQYLDFMAMYKLNRFHWHLTDDQGWRLEIKKYPLLTSIGANRKGTRLNHSREKVGQYEDKPYGGFYTQEQAKDIVAYAKQRHIEVIPEIEMPGHTQAAITAYPWLGSGAQKTEVWRDWGVSDEILNPSDSTINFLKSVMDEVVGIFPYTFIHIGGDEAVKKQWKNNPKVQARMKSLSIANEEKLQAWMIKQVGDYVASRYQRKIIGWDEILEGEIESSAIMSWRGTKGGIAAAFEKKEVVMSPGFPLYFDAYQTKNHNGEPQAIGGRNTLKDVFSFKLVPDTVQKAGLSNYIIGVQANVWTEYIRDFKTVQYFLFPRITALSELGWHSGKSKLSYADFRKRVVEAEAPRWKKQGINFSQTGLDEIKE